MFRKPIRFKVRTAHPREGDVTAMTGSMSAERVIRGLLRLEGDDVVLQFRVLDHVLDFTGLRGGTGESTEAGEAQEIRVPLSRLGDVRMRGWWWGKLTLTSTDLTTFEDLGSHDGRVTLTIPRRMKADAADFATALAFKLSDLELEGIDEEMRRLEEG